MSLDVTPVDHPIAARWPAQHPDRLQLYSFPTPNGIKVSAMLEETGIPYEPHLVRLSGDQTTPEFLALNPNNKIPAIIDPDGPGGRPLALFESGRSSSTSPRRPASSWPPIRRRGSRPSSG